MNDDYNYKVPLPRIELGTLRLADVCSILMSYRGTVFFISQYTDKLRHKKEKAEDFHPPPLPSS